MIPEELQAAQAAVDSVAVEPLGPRPASPVPMPVPSAEIRLAMQNVLDADQIVPQAGAPDMWYSDTDVVRDHNAVSEDDESPIWV